MSIKTTDTEKTLEYLEKHENRLRKEVHKFLWEFSRAPYETDLYFYPDTHEFYSFVNAGGNSWLNDNHIVLASVNGEFVEIEKGCFREYVNEMTEVKIDDIFSRLADEIKLEKYYY